MNQSSFSENSTLLLENLLQFKLQEDVIIGIALENEVFTSVITLDEYDSDTELSLRYHLNGHFDLYYRYYNDDIDQYETIIHDLTNEQASNLPEGLITVMKKAISSETSITVSNKSLR